jgi:hypothetical protein
MCLAVATREALLYGSSQAAEQSRARARLQMTTRCDKVCRRILQEALGRPDSRVTIAPLGDSDVEIDGKSQEVCGRCGRTLLAFDT